jgi:hypothetical protein
MGSTLPGDLKTTMKLRSRQNNRSDHFIALHTHDGLVLRAPAFLRIHREKSKGKPLEISRKKRFPYKVPTNAQIFRGVTTLSRFNPETP